MSGGTLTEPALLLDARGLWHRYPRAERWALRDVSLKLEQGAALGVVGESGCGKSTLARVLSRLLQPSQGQLLLAGVDWARARGLRGYHSQVQLIFQDAAAALSPRRSIAQSLLEPLQARKLKTPGQHLPQLLEQVGLEPALLTRYPHQLSGGQRQRVVIARALAVQPRVLIADEPLAALDVSVQAQILNLLAHLRAQLGLSILLISHDLAAVASLCPQLLVMHQGEVVEQGATAKLLRDPAHPQTRALLSWARHPLRGVQDSPEPGCDTGLIQ